MKKFKELELLVNPLKDQLATNFAHLSTKVNEIKVKGKWCSVFMYPIR